VRASHIGLSEKNSLSMLPALELAGLAPAYWFVSLVAEALVNEIAEKRVRFSGTEHAARCPGCCSSGSTHSSTPASIAQHSPGGCSGCSANCSASGSSFEHPFPPTVIETRKFRFLQTFINVFLGHCLANLLEQFIGIENRALFSAC